MQVGDNGKIKVFYFNNGTGGGVLSVIRNLLKHKQSSEIENHVVYTINKEQVKDFRPPRLYGAVSEQVFYYSPRWNFHHTCKKLSELLPDDKAVLAANDWLELGMVSHIGLSNPVIQILHGDYEYYYNLAIKHKEAIDAYVTVAEVMAEHLRKKIPDRGNGIYYLPFPVPAVVPKSFLHVAAALQIIFVGRLTKSKGYNLLPFIENELKRKGIVVKWHIVGEQTVVEESVWLSGAEVEFYGQVPNDKVIEIMQKVDCLLLPSISEGMPVTLVEAMKVGLTCLVNDLPGGIQELVVDRKTGFKIKRNEVASYVDVLEQLNNNRPLLQEIGENAKEKATAHFDPVANTTRYEELFVKCFRLKKNKREVTRVYGSRLDQPWIPNFITTAIRNFSQ